MLEDTHYEDSHDDGESEPNGIMGQKILVVHLPLYGLLTALNGLRIREDRTVSRRVYASDETLSPNKALQDS